MTIAGLATLGAVHPAFSQDQDPRKDSTEATTTTNSALLDVLPFEDTSDFDNANKGLIAPLPADTI
jgi:alkyl sulfatase BDS1-like metallo-beta-lactamase superfamily hydrolase